MYVVVSIVNLPSLFSLNIVTYSYTVFYTLHKVCLTIKYISLASYLYSWSMWDLKEKLSLYLVYKICIYFIFSIAILMSVVGIEMWMITFGCFICYHRQKLDKHATSNDWYGFLYSKMSVTTTNERKYPSDEVIDFIFKKIMIRG